MPSDTSSNGNSNADAISLSNQILEIFGNAIGVPQFHVMDKIAELLRKRFHAANCAIFWQTDSPEILELVGSANIFWENTGDEVVRFSKSNAEHGGLLNWLGTLHAPLRMNHRELRDNNHKRRAIPEEPLGHLGGHDRYSLMFSPLLQGADNAVGFIKIENKLNDQQLPVADLEFTPDELDLFHTLSIPIAMIGCMRAQASSQTKNAIERIMRSTEGRKDWRALLQTILEEIKRLLDAERGEIAWWTANVPDGGLIYVALVGDRTDDAVSLDNVVPKGAFIQKVFRNDKSDHQLIADVKRSKLRGVPYFEAHHRTQSELALRIDLFANPVGVLNVESFSPNHFRPEHLPTLRLLAQQAALAVHQMQREHLISKSLNQPFMAILDNAVPGAADISTSIEAQSGSAGGSAYRDNPRPDHSQIVQPVLCGLLEAFGFDRGIVYRFDPIGGGLFVAASMHEKDIAVDPKTFYHPLNRGSFARLVFDLPVNAEPVIERSPETSANVDQVAREAWRISGRLLGYPLSFRGQKVGCLVLWCKERPFPHPPPRARLDQLAILAAARIALWQAEQRVNSDMAFFKSLPSETSLIIFTKRVTQWEPRDEIPDGVKPGDTKFVFDWANGNFLEWVGRVSVEGLTDWDLFPENALEYYTGDLLALSNKSVDGRSEQNIRPKDKQTRHVSVWKHRLPDDAVIGRRIQVVFWDRTDARKLEEDNAALVRDLRHRVYECIHHIYAFLDAIAEDQSRLDAMAEGPSNRKTTPEVLRDCMVRVQAQEAVIARLYGRRTGEPIEMQAFIHDVVKCVESCYARLIVGGAEGLHGIRCIIDVQQTKFIERIAISCGMIVTELVANAFRHAYPSATSGRVTVELFTGGTSGDSWHLRVTDDGIGCDIASPFPSRAIGLGLVDEVVKKHLGGRLLLMPANSSRTNPGLSVEVTFSSSKPPPPPVVDPNESVGAGLILLVEDDPVMGLRYKEILESHQYKVIGPIHEYSQVTNYVTKYGPAVVVLDILLDGDAYAGLDLARNIRAASDVPILFLTLHEFSDVEVERARKEIESTGYLQKTAFVMPHLLERVRSLISQSRPPSTIFICYAHKRQNECDELSAALRPVCSEGLLLSIETVKVNPASDDVIVTWSDREIRSGDAWEEEITKAIKRCAIGILLIDIDWINSSFIQRREFPELLKKAKGDSGIILLPVRLDPCFIPDKIRDVVFSYQFVGDTKQEGRSLDERSNTDHGLKTERSRVWAEIAKRVNEFKKQMVNKIKRTAL